jgi:hypothetical protein
MVRNTIVKMCLLACFAGTVRADLKADIESLTGNQHTRIAWLQGGARIEGGGALMGYDSKSNIMKQILPAGNWQSRPIICGGGNKVVVTINQKVHIVNWDGTDKRYLVDGFASDVWLEPGTGKEWVFIRRGNNVIRYRIDDVSQAFQVWNKGNVGINYMPWWAVSADGKMAAEFLPWPDACVIDNGAYTLNGATTLLGDGCWSSVENSNNYNWMHLGPNHSHISTYRSKSRQAQIALPLGPDVPAGTQQNEFYHPKFASNGDRIFCITGGYHGNSDSPDAQVFICRLAADYRSVEKWVRVTTNNPPNYTPDAWVGVVAPGPALGLSAQTIELSMTLGGQAPSARTVTVSNTGSGTLPAVTAVENADWLTATVTGKTDNTYEIANTVTNATSLASGIHQTAVTVSAAGMQSVSYTVKLTMTAPPVLATITVTPVNASVEPGKTLQFIAKGLDQFNNPFPLSGIQWRVSGGGTINGSTGLFGAGTKVGGPYTVTAASGGLEGTATLQVAVAPQVTLAVNCGGGALPGWVADDAYVQGGDVALRTNLQVTGTDNPALYQSERFGNSMYEFAVPAGPYKVRLHFCEGYDQITAAGQRVFSIMVENATIENLDIFKEAGGRNCVLIKSLDVTVSDGSLSIEFVGKVQNPCINAIEILSPSSGETAKRIVMGALSTSEFKVGDTVTLTWSAADDIAGVTIEASVDNQKSWFMITSGNAITRTGTDPVWGTYSFVIPESFKGVPMVSPTVWFRIADYFQGATFAELGPLSISESNSLAYGHRTATYTGFNRHSVIRMSNGRLSSVTIMSGGAHEVRVHALSGACIVVRSGAGPAQYLFDRSMIQAGTYCVTVRAGSQTQQVRFVQSR